MSKAPPPHEEAMPNSTPTIEPTFPPHEEVFLSNAPIVETPPLEPTVLEEDEVKCYHITMNL